MVKFTVLAKYLEAVRTHYRRLAYPAVVLHSNRDLVMTKNLGCMVLLKISQSEIIAVAKIQCFGLILRAL